VAANAFGSAGDNRGFSGKPRHDSSQPRYFHARACRERPRLARSSP
jgi:hypothetical protein